MQHEQHIYINRLQSDDVPLNRYDPTNLATWGHMRSYEVI